MSGRGLWVYIPVLSSGWTLVRLSRSLGIGLHLTIFEVMKTLKAKDLKIGMQVLCREFDGNTALPITQALSPNNGFVRFMIDFTASEFPMIGEYPICFKPNELIPVKYL